MARVRVSIGIQGSAAILLSVCYLVVFARAGGRQGLLGTAVYLLLPWLLLTNAEALGDYAFGSPGGRYLSITRATPRVVVVIIGWLFLVAPSVYYLAVIPR